MAFGATTPAYKQGTAGAAYPFTKMNFVVSIATAASGAAFTEITGLDANVDVVEFRQGNSNSLAPVKIPGLVKHGNITMKYGVTTASDFRNWIAACINSQRDAIPRADIMIELIDTIKEAPKTIQDTATAGSAAAGMTWTLTGAWVTKYSGVDLNAMQSEVAIESIEVAYEELTTIPMPAV
jgi:phage tail-like protein